MSETLSQIVAFVLITTLAFGWPFVGWLRLLEASRQHEVLMRREREEKALKRQREAAELAMTLRLIAKEHGLLKEREPEPEEAGLPETRKAA